VAVAVFDADVLIAYLGRGDAHHVEAVERMRRALEPGTRRLVSAVNYTEVLIGPLKTGGPTAAEVVDAMFVRFGIETITVDMALAQRAAAVRAKTNLKVPDAYAVATAIHAEHRGWEDVRLESFDDDVVKAYADLHPRP
jgi:predicted nucleic acid-binding protein